METNTYTIFTKYESGYEGHLDALEGSLDECILTAASFWFPKEGGFATPTAWGAGCGGGKAARAKAIAAGRTIELVDGKFVARGVAEPKPAQTLGDLLRKAGDRLPSKTPTLDKLEAGNAAMIARDGIAKPVAIRGTPAPCPSYGQCTYPECSHFLNVSKDAAKPALSFLTYSPDLQPSSHQVGPKFGSALLRG